MVTEAPYANLSADLVHGGRRSPFIDRTDIIESVRAIFPSFGIEAEIAAPGIMKARCNGVYHPTVFVDNEDFFWQIPERDKKFQVRGKTPREWRRKGVLVLDVNWADKSVVAYWVLQQYLMKGCPPDLFWSDPELSDQARDATRGFVAQGLDDLHRRKWYNWLQIP